MSEAREELLRKIADDVGRHGLGDRSVRDIAAAVGSSHRMVLYHFGSRAGLVTALVELTERAQRELLLELAATPGDVVDLSLAVWRRVSSPELEPFVRLFFECVAATGGQGLTTPWLEVVGGIAAADGLDDADVRLAIAVSRGLLIDVLAGERDAADDAMERFVGRWSAAGGGRAAGQG